MNLTEEQIRNGYPLEAVRFMKTFDKYLSDGTDEYGLKKCRPDSFEVFKEVGADKPQESMIQYEESLSAIHSYLSKGFQL